MGYGAYDKMVGHLGDVDSVLPTALALEASAAVKGVQTALVPMQITGFGFLVTVAFNYDTQTTEGVIALKKYVAFGSSVGAKTLATLKLTDALAAGKVVFKDISSADGLVKPGEQIVIEITTQAAGGTEAGDFQPFYTWHPAAEVAGNCSAVVKQT